ncbi:MAG TPA: lipoyl(octanoyl) transferase LipB [Bacteroidales bacterium]|nr:lipoyl(octanoyl) transferase LipB [Bacteroidales bacterium]
MSYSVLYQDIGVRDYEETWKLQQTVFNQLLDVKNRSRDAGRPVEESSAGRLIFVEHPHVYTLGKSGSENNLLINSIQLRAKEAKFIKTDRGGDITYHGPGQIVGYPIFDLEKMGIGLKDYIYLIEEAVVVTLAGYGLTASRLKGATGVWLDPDKPRLARKICAIGVRASRYVTMHGFAFNINTDLTYFNYINPCGFTDRGVTSIEKELSEKQDFENAKAILRNNLGKCFGLNWIK